MQGLHPDGLDFFLHGFSEIPIRRWALEEPTDQRFKVKRSAADEQYKFASALDFGDFGVSVVEKLRDAVVFGGIDDIDQMVRDLLAFLLARFGRSDVHASVDGHGIDRDDFGSEVRLARCMVAECMCQTYGYLTLSRRGWTGQVKDVVQGGGDPVGGQIRLRFHRIAGR